MPSRIYSYFPERKITNPNPPANAKPGSAPAVNVRTASWPGLPGTASNGFAKAKAGIKEVNGYAMYAGLSQKKWIQGAIKHPGALTKKAKKAGESPMEYAHEHMHDSGKTGKQARLAMTLRNMHK
jgi:hypothetical protein